MESKQTISPSTVFLSFVILFLLLLVLVYGWPTRYRYEHIQNNILIRIDRFNGNVDVLRIDEGWKRVEREQAFKPRP